MICCQQGTRKSQGEGKASLSCYTCVLQTHTERKSDAARGSQAALMYLCTSRVRQPRTEHPHQANTHAHSQGKQHHQTHHLKERKHAPHLSAGRVSSQITCCHTHSCTSFMLATENETSSEHALQLSIRCRLSLSLSAVAVRATGVAPRISQTRQD